MLKKDGDKGVDVLFQNLINQAEGMLPSTLEAVRQYCEAIKPPEIKLPRDLTHEEFMESCRLMHALQEEVAHFKNLQYKQGYARFGILGVIIMVVQRARRLESMIFDDDGNAKLTSREMLVSVANEGSVLDQLVDLANYATYSMFFFNPQLVLESVRRGEERKPSVKSNV